METAGSKRRRCRRLLPDRQHSLALHPRAELAKDARIAAEGQGFAGVAISYNARSRSEVDAAPAEVEAAGAILLKPALRRTFGAAIPDISPIPPTFPGRSPGTHHSLSRRTEASVCQSDGPTFSETYQLFCPHRTSGTVLRRIPTYIPKLRFRTNSMSRRRRSA